MVAFEGGSVGKVETNASAWARAGGQARLEGGVRRIIVDQEVTLVMCSSDVGNG